MLFTSALFAWVYLPVVLAGFFAIGRFSEGGAALWLFLASLAFYAAWMPEFTLLLLASICFNFVVGRRIGASRSRTWLTFGVSANLLLLAYYKYAGFLVSNVNALTGSHWDLGQIILPIGISFFTFTQIAFLVDAYAKGVREPRFVHYGLFVTYFPHLVAGPVLHHAQMMPQFGLSKTYRFDFTNFGVGLGIFALGLFKKVVLADGISPYADAVFNAADAGAAITVEEAWLGALAYTLQLYFDFSGYSDMAVGLSWMLNIKLPFNFNSPYRSTTSASSGGTGTSPCPAFCATISTSPWAETAGARRGAMPTCSPPWCWAVCGTVPAGPLCSGARCMAFTSSSSSFGRAGCVPRGSRAVQLHPPQARGQVACCRGQSPCWPWWWPGCCSAPPRWKGPSPCMPP